MSDLYTAEGVINKNSLWERYYPLIRHEALKLQVRLPASVDIDDLIQAGVSACCMQWSVLTPCRVPPLQPMRYNGSAGQCWMNCGEEIGPPQCAPSGAEITKAVRALEQSLGRAAAEQEIADSLQMDIAEYRQVLTDTNNSQLFSYDEWHEIHGESCEPVRDDDDGGNPLGLLVDESLRHQVVEAIKQLPEREKLVLTLYYQEELNLKEIGAVLEVGESRVSQLHNQAIKGCGRA